MSILDLQIFSTNALADSEGLAVALRILESCLAGPDVHLDLILQDLCSVPNLFEFVISVLPNGRELVSKIMDSYPTDPALVETSYTATLLQTLSSNLFTLPPDVFSTVIARRIREYKVYVEDALPVLTLFCSTDFSTGIPTARPTRASENDKFYERNKKQGKSKQKDKGIIDLTPFLKLRCKVPSNHAEAIQMARKIVDDLKVILKFSLELLLEPFLAQRLKDAYLLTGNDTNSAYAKVQRLKAALYFENTDELGEWRVVLSTSTIKKLRELANGDRKECNIVLKKIRQLSNGRFSGDNQKRLNGPFGVPIFEAKMQRDLRLVYQIDTVPDHDGYVDRQAIKIYGIYTHTQPIHIWNAIGQHLAGKGVEYTRRCIARNGPIDPGSDVYLPAYFPSENLEDDIKALPLELSDEDKEQLHSLLVLEKYITFSRAFWHSLIANEDLQHVFELHPQERRIVECNTSCYVLGRSGTGKTTTMLFKMLGIQRAWQVQASGSDMLMPRQIFVTKSRVLANKVEKYFTELLESLALASCSLGDLKKKRAQNTEAGLVDLDDNERTDIPQKYSLLEESHFPLFVTFDKLARMIAADILSDNDPEVRRAARILINAKEIEAETSFVTYDIFVRTYWPRFPQSLSMGLDPWLVFSEFMGVIKGSEKSLSCPDGFLDETTYCGLSRSNPTLANHRQTVYALFQIYCRLKKQRYHHDIADRSQAILKALQNTFLKAQRVDYLYVDEAQDNLLIDALILRLICRNPEGMFWAGDTAQTISAGSSFRFNELRAFLYHIERDHNSNVVRDRSVADPEMFQLTKNYRSHGGIVDCAHTVVERITHFWPDAIDRLKRERGTVDGWKPVFLRSWDKDAVQYEQFLFGESGCRVEFGAHQCILVRDDKALEKLREEVGEIGLIMTLYDSKGLEFNDVLLYNFFGDSAVDASLWSLLLNNEEGEVDGKDLVNMRTSYPANEVRFAGVCSELKMLYVGITRARRNLWIFDKSDKSEPMRTIWTSRNQIRNYTPGTKVQLPHLAVSSDSAEWEPFGHELFSHKKYPQAMYCFTKAKQPRMTAICNAFHLREVARAKVGVAPPKVQEVAFLVAADAFTKSGKDAPSGKDKLQYYRNAAECYVHGGDDRKAAVAYLSAQEYDLAARRFRKAGLFDETLEVLHKYSQEISADCSEELYNVCRLFYCSKHDRKRPRLPLFSTFEEEEEFLKDYDLDSARAALLETHGRYMEAAELHLSEKRPFDAIRDLLKERSYDGVQRATKIILDGLWQRCSFAITPKDVAADRGVTELLSWAHKLHADFVDLLDRHEISMFCAIAQADLPSLGKLVLEFMNGNRKSAALLALDHFFSQPPELKSYKTHEMSHFLAKFVDYARLIHLIISHPDPLSVDSIRQLFCIRQESTTEYALQPGSFLHNPATHNHNGPLYSEHSRVILSKNDAVSALRKYLAEHLLERVTEENRLCRKAPAFSLCLTFITTERCNRCSPEHVKREELDVKRYNLRLRIHLQQIYILQLMFAANPYPRTHTRAIMLDWLTCLYEAINPQSHVQGSIADFDLSPTPGAQEGMRVMKLWVREALYDLRPGRPDFVTTVLRLTSLLFAFDKSSAVECINKAKFHARHLRVQQLVYPDDQYVVEDIVRFLDGTQNNSISSGLKFLSHILETSQDVNLSVFCDLLEQIIGKICVSWRLSYYLPLDGLLLPRGWFFTNSDFSIKKGVWVALTGTTLDRVKDLLIHLQSDATRSPYTLRDTNLTHTLRNIFTSRMALCFLFYNVRNPHVRHKVRGIFNALRPAEPTQRAHSMYRRYVEARGSEYDYLSAVVAYDIEAKVVIEDLVQLLHKQRNPLHSRPLRMSRIKDIHFASPSEIPSLLSTQLVAARSELWVEAPAFVPQDVVRIEKIEEDKAQPEEPDVEQVGEVHEDLDPEELAQEPALIHEHEPTEQEVDAAKKILTAYRKYRQHHDAQIRAIGKGLKARKHVVFNKCWKNVRDPSNKWGKTPYRTIYLWALPQLVVCLDRVIAIAHRLKGKTKNLFSKESHDRLEELGKRMNQISALIKEGDALRKRIDPDATMHLAENRDKAKMKKAILDVEDIINRLPVRALEIQDDFDFAYKLVMVEKRQVLKPKKPELNTEDLDMYFSDETTFLRYC